MQDSAPQQPSTQLVPVEEQSPKSAKIAFTMACLGGFLGLHRFYTDRPLSGLLMLLSFGGCFLWWILDVIIMLSGRFKDNKGRVLGPPRHVRRPAGALPDKSNDDVLPDPLEDPLEEEFARLEQEMSTDGEP